MSSLARLPDLSLLAIIGSLPVFEQLQMAPVCRHWARVIVPELCRRRRRLFLLLDDGSHQRNKTALELITRSPNRVHNHHLLRDYAGRPLRPAQGDSWIAPVARSTLIFSVPLSDSTIGQLICHFPALKQLTISTSTESVDAETIWSTLLVPLIGALSSSLRRLHLYGYYGVWSRNWPQDQSIGGATVSYSIARQFFQALNKCTHLRDLTLELRHRYGLPTAKQAKDKLDLFLLRQLDTFTYLNIAINIFADRNEDFLWSSILRHAVPGPRPLRLSLRKNHCCPPLCVQSDLSPFYQQLPVSFTRRCIQTDRFHQTAYHSYPGYPEYGIARFSGITQVELLLIQRLETFLAPLAQLPSLVSLGLICFDMSNLRVPFALERVHWLVAQGQLPILQNVKSFFIHLRWSDNSAFLGHTDFIDFPIAAFCPALQVLELQLEHPFPSLLTCELCHLEAVSSETLMAAVNRISAGHQLKEETSVEEKCIRQLLEPLLACNQLHTLLLSFVETREKGASFRPLCHRDLGAIRIAPLDTLEINWTDLKKTFPSTSKQSANNN